MEEHKLDNEKIKQIRKKLGLNQTQMAKELGVSMRTVQNWEGGKRTIPDWVSINIRNMSASFNEKEEVVLEKDGVKLSIEEIISFVAENEDSFMEKKIFSNIIEVRVAKKIAEITSSKENLFNFLSIDN